ncbi:hypothetical protein [Dichelobacter nodosus]|uniref:hypothetical protein n=1 Tax=Dichelobacter nodosus TaxID=870 RepID=UPI0039E9F782
MANPIQLAATAALLAVEIEKLTNDELIELCLLYRANPEADKEFPLRLEQELARRFDRDTLFQNPTDYAVLQHLANGYKYKPSIMARFINTIKDSADMAIWHETYASSFAQLLDDDNALDLFFADTKAVEILLKTQNGVLLFAKNVHGSRRLLQNTYALSVLHQSNGWEYFSSEDNGMSVLAESTTLLTEIIEQGNLPLLLSHRASYQKLLTTPAAINVLIHHDKAVRYLLTRADFVADLYQNDAIRNAFFAHRAAVDLWAGQTAAMGDLITRNLIKESRREVGNGTSVWLWDNGVNIQDYSGMHLTLSYDLYATAAPQNTGTITVRLPLTLSDNTLQPQNYVLTLPAMVDTPAQMRVIHTWLLPADIKSSDSIEIHHQADGVYRVRNLQVELGRKAGFWRLATSELPAPQTPIEAAIKDKSLWLWLLSQDVVRQGLSDSSVAMAAVAASDVAMAAVAASDVAMAAVAASDVAMAAVAASDVARQSIIAHNDIFQQQRNTLYDTVQKSWVIKSKQAQDGVANANAAIAAPFGLVFACLGYYGSSNGKTKMLHFDGSLAAVNRTTSNPQKMNSVDAVSFNSATFTEEGDGYVYCELWAAK